MVSEQSELRPRLFADRAAAGRVLAEALRGLVTPAAVAVGLARGGVVVAAEIARVLDLALDVVAVRKVGAPWQPEYALGAVAPGAGVFLHDRAGLTDEALRAIVDAAQQEAEELDRRLHRDYAAVGLAGRMCVLVDDGLATGATMAAAVRWARSHDAARIVPAVPVGAAASVAALEAECEAVVCPYRPEQFWAVGLWYELFGPVEDAEIVRLLAEARSR